ncbi:hypothetical protein HHK36_025806 [Tetracentron sinense]|uniref:Gag1-like clamp domain-containing protein n=1 Tax=Tetracentron sinense TaxID=13715 RepID=A0A834YJG1_TETSI|nr:hypothetical protein HHK36_025806 [Tetracentron sinense]
MILCKSITDCFGDILACMGFCFCSEAVQLVILAAISGYGWMVLIVYAVKPDLQQSRGCLGCCTKPTPIIAVDEPSKGLRIQGRTVKKPSILEDFWSTSTCEMDNSAVQSQRSISPISISNQTLDPHSATGSTSNPSEFVNHGLLLWNQTRQQWVGNRRSENNNQRVREPRLSWNVTYDSLLGTNKRFTQPILLSEMVEFLVDIWEQEGMYD